MKHTFKTAKAFRTTGLLALLLMIGTTCTQAAFWELKGSIGTHDPTIIKEDSLWWQMNTGKGIPVKYSTDGITWTDGVRLFAEPLSWWKNYAPNMTTNDVWAPDLHSYNGRVWCYYSVSEFGKNNSAIGLASCSKIITGDWRDDGMVISSKSGSTSYNAIDPNLVIDASGNPWLVFGSWFDGIKLTKLNKSTMKPTGSLYSLAKKSGGIEAPVIVYRSGYYYLFVSIGVCCNGVNSTYKVAYGRSKEITGPYKDKDGKNMTSGYCSLLDTGNSRWVGPGGQDVHQNGSKWVIARHAYDATDNGNPKLLINDLNWDSSGWPTY